MTKSVLVKTVMNCHLKIFCSKVKIMSLEEEHHTLVEGLKLKESVINGLKKRLFSYDNFVIDEKLFRTTTGLEVEKFNILFEYLRS